MNKQEFVASIKAKYPVYKDIADDELFTKVTKKYPQYLDQIKDTGTTSKGKSVLEGAIGGKMGIENAITGAEMAGGFTPFSPAIFGAGEGARALYKGKPIPEALKRAGMATMLDLAMVGTTKYKPAVKAVIKHPLLAKAIDTATNYPGASEIMTQVAGGVLKGSAQAVKKIPEWMMAHAIKKPEVLAVPQRLTLDTANDIVQATIEYKKKLGSNFASLIQTIPGQNKKVSTIGVKNAIAKYGESPKILAAQISSFAKAERKELSDEVLEKFVSGGKIPFKDAKAINSALFLMEEEIRKKGGSELIKGGTNTIHAYKTANLQAMENVAPGIRNLHRIYAGERRLADQTMDILSKGQNPEARIKLVAEQLAGKISNKTKDARILTHFQEKSGIPIVEKLKDSIVREKFEQQIENNLFTYMTPQALAASMVGFGAGGGGVKGGLMAGGANLLTTQILPRLLTSERIGKGIQLAQKAPGYLKYGTTPARIGFERLVLGGQ